MKKSKDLRNAEKIMFAGTGEKTQYIAHRYNDNTVRFVVLYNYELNLTILRQAVATIVNAVEVLHSSFIPGNLSAYWTVNMDYSFDELALYKETDGNVMEVAQNEVIDPIVIDGKLQLRCTLVTDHKQSAIALAISHLCVDGSDGKYILFKIIEAYNMISECGNTKNLDIKQGTRATEQVYDELSHKKYLALMKYPMSKVKSVFPFPDIEQELNKRFIVRTIDADMMHQARRKAKDYEASMNDVLLSACYRAFVRMPNVKIDGPISITSMMDLRKHCKDGESAGISNISGILPTTLMEGISGDFEDTLKEITRQTKAVKEDELGGLYGLPLIRVVLSTLPYKVARDLAELAYGNMSIGLTNLGNIPNSSLTIQGHKPRTGFFAGPLKKKPAMQIATATFNNEAVLSIATECGDEDAKVLQLMLDTVVEEIHQFVD